jgi:hypothetical protein
MLLSLRRWGLVAAVAALVMAEAACAINPQPEPPADMGTGGTSASGGSGGTDAQGPPGGIDAGSTRDVDDETNTSGGSGGTGGSGTYGDAALNDCADGDPCGIDPDAGVADVDEAGEAEPDGATDDALMSDSANDDALGGD